jgi:two-component system NtrC family sensor kinase
MSADSSPPAPKPSAPAVDVASEDTLLLLNRAMLVMHTVRGAAHELNNVLQMISGSAELLELNPECPASMVPRLQAIGTHTGRGNELVAGVADLARGPLPRGQVMDVGKAIERVRQLRRFEQSRAGVELSLEFLTQSLIARVDPMDLQLMLLNLIINAEQAVASAPVKTIVIAAVADGGSCRITMTDSGGGEVPHREPGKPVASTRLPHLAAGLGLAATETLVRRHGGTLTLRRAASGVEAAIVLPLATT